MNSLINEIAKYILNEYEIKINKNKIKKIISENLICEKINKLNYGVEIVSFILPENLHCDFNLLWNLKPNTKEDLIIYGKTLKAPRYFKQYLQDYTFSGVKHKGYTLNDNIPGEACILKLLNFVRSYSKLNYNGVLINWYADGNEYIGYHSDDESELVNNSDIYSITFGATRDFLLKDKTTKQVSTYPLVNNTVLIMKSYCQKYYQHSVPKRLKCKDPRINITFRLYKITT
jgi:alkylated DNA repair dioxygenase AlkB